jgi:uncharacterized repeat protein (TIGR03847 family)
MSPSFDFDAPEHFIAGEVGPPGQRVFYLQARESGTLVTLKIEKEQVAVLGEHLARLLAKLSPVVTAAPPEVGLLPPIEAAWAVGSLGVGYDEDNERIVIVANELVEEGAAEEPATARFLITPAQAAAFVAQARELIKAGRPLCPLCSRPQDPSGHICARRNGYLARSG